MGYVREELIVVTGWQPGRLASLHGLAVEVFGPERVSAILSAVVKGAGYFLVGGSGSKVGWPEAEAHSARVEQFVAAAEADAGWVDVLVVSVGDSALDFGVRRWYNTETDGWGPHKAGTSDLPTRARDALRRLHEQGRIASPWMAGMRPTFGRRTDETYRLTWTFNSQRDEMTPIMGLPSTDEFVMWGWPSPDSGWCPDPSDPATRGCLLELAREASGLRVYLGSDFGGRYFVAADDGSWIDGHPEIANGDTEPEALVAALEALAEQGS